MLSEYRLGLSERVGWIASVGQVLGRDMSHTWLCWTWIVFVHSLLTASVDHVYWWLLTVCLGLLPGCAGPSDSLVVYSCARAEIDWTVTDFHGVLHSLDDFQDSDFDIRWMVSMFPKVSVLLCSLWPNWNISREITTTGAGYESGLEVSLLLQAALPDYLSVARLWMKGRL